MTVIKDRMTQIHFLPPAVVAQLRHLQLELLDGGVAEDGPLQQELRL